MGQHQYVVIFVQCVVISLILCTKNAESATLLFTTEGEGHLPSTSVSKPVEEDTHVYLFVADGKKKPYSYVNDVGTLVGFDVDIVNEVCKMAGKKCFTVLAEFTECIFTYKAIDYAGRGLMAEWFDGCPGYQITIDRQNEFDFTLPYLDSSASFTVAPGNPSKFDPRKDDFSKFTLLHLTGAPTNAPCLRRLHKKVGKILIANDLPEAKAMLLNGTADVLFSPRNQIDGLDVLPERVRCDAGGAGIMLKKGSSIPAWWNPVYQTFYFSGKYTKLCDNAARKYGAKVNCLPPPDRASPELLSLLKTPQAPVPEKMWMFVVSGRIEPFSYLDDEGNLVGFTKDFLNAVCKIAGKDCVLLLAQVPECSVRKGELLYPGRGLMEGWFDACTGYFDTFDRDNSWDFTSPYLLSNASFYVANDNPTGFDPDSDDYSGFTIVYQATAITNDHCLNRLHKKFDKLIVVENLDEAVAMVQNGTADAWFTKETDVDQLEQLPQRFHCENVGTSIMTRKGGELPGWWDVAFETFYTTGDYHKFCQEQGKLHDYNFPCIPPPDKMKHSMQTLEGF